MRLRSPFARTKLRFQVVTILLLLALTLLLTTAFLISVGNKFEAMAEESARVIFGQVSEVGVTRLRTLGDAPGKFVRVQAETVALAALDGDEPGVEALRRRFLAALDQDPNVYAYYLGLANGDFLQVIAIRDNPDLRATLSAPAEAAYAVRSIAAPSAGQPRQARWRFLGRDRSVVGERREATDYDPRQRPWYQAALAGGGYTLTAPYLFQSSREPGITAASPLADRAGVMAADVSVQNLNRFLDQISTTPRTVTALVDGQNRLVGLGAGPEAGRHGNLAPLKPLAETGNGVLAFFAAWTLPPGAKAVRIADLAGEKYVLAQSSFELSPGIAYRAIAYAPMSEFSGYILKARNEMLLIAGLILLVSLPLTYQLARRSSEALGMLASDARRIQELDFSDTPTVRSAFQEIDTLGQTQQFMRTSLRERTEQLTSTQARLEYLVEMGLALSGERDRMALLRKILEGGRTLLNCDAGTMYLVTERDSLQIAMITNDLALPQTEFPLHDPATGKANDHYAVIHATLHNELMVIDDVATQTRYDLSGTKAYMQASGYPVKSMLVVPLAPRNGEVIGVLQYMNALDPETGTAIPFRPDLMRFLTALAAEAAVALDNHQLVEAQEALMDALIRLIAGAIDAKSPYTGGHCERVPELGIMLAEAASAVSEGPLAGFRFDNEDEWREFRVGAWLHDCGKVTTPEYVVDKATKLETLYNRIHEIRMRFEVLLRDAQIERLEAVAAGADPVTAEQAFAARRTQLLDDFAFVAECNLGGEFMAPERIERLKNIAGQVWLRHFDDRLGLGHEELLRYAGAPEPLPVAERLLADKPQHLLARGPNQALDPEYGFQLKVPEHLYNHGELYNLSIGRGTLTDEERFKINEHIIQTIAMLENLPFPKNMRRVPEYAGTHHETLDGTGYPRKLAGEQLSIPSRIMAIADIFEALTASDRPYKKAKTLSEAIKILARFKQKGHIDPDLFDLFLTSGVYRRYAERFLLPEQIDAVEIGQYLN
jgi:HD-GYP domain-containing protein (c-di-GMP phosphodiesterase class II)